MSAGRMSAKHPRKRRAKPVTKSGPPAGFGWKWVFWWIWKNAITVLMVVQFAVSAVTLDPTVLPPTVFHWTLIVNSVLCFILAQIKRDHPPPKGKKK
jgi:hypothetical protein